MVGSVATEVSINAGQVHPQTPRRMRLQSDELLWGDGSVDTCCVGMSHGPQHPHENGNSDMTHIYSPIPERRAIRSLELTDHSA